MKIAFFSPLQPIRSGISDYAGELLAALGAQLDPADRITLVVDGYTPTNVPPGPHFQVLQDSVYQAHAFDLALYQLGNSPAHAYIFKRALVEPGIIVLHDLVLHHLVAWLTLNHGDRAGYIEAMRAAYGEPGAQLAEREALGLDALNRFDYPLSEQVIRASRGVIVHSRYVATAVQKIAPHLPVAIIPHEIPPGAPIARRDARAQLQLSPDIPLVGSFGNLGPTKRTTVLLDAFRSVHQHLPRARLLLVGAISPNLDLTSLLDLFQVRDAVEVLGHVPLDSFQRYMAAVDVCMNLRYPTAGETSGAVLRMMAQGGVVMVSRIGWFAELPDDAVAKIDIDDAETEMVRVMLERLLEDAPLRRAMGAHARRYIEENCAPADAATAYLDFMRAVHRGDARSKNYFRAAGAPSAPPASLPLPSVSHGTAGPDRITPDSPPASPPPQSHGDWRDELTRAYVALGLGEKDAVLGEVARAVAELGLND